MISFGVENNALSVFLHTHTENTLLRGRFGVSFGVIPGGGSGGVLTRMMYHSLG